MLPSNIPDCFVDAEARRRQWLLSLDFQGIVLSKAQPGSITKLRGIDSPRYLDYMQTLMFHDSRVGEGLTSQEPQLHCLGLQVPLAKSTRRSSPAPMASPSRAASGCADLSMLAGWTPKMCSWGASSREEDANN